MAAAVAVAAEEAAEPSFGVQTGYSAGTGYDLATGLGSVTLGICQRQRLGRLYQTFRIVSLRRLAQSRPPCSSARDWQPAARAIAITSFSALAILMLGFRQRSRAIERSHGPRGLCVLLLTAG